MSLCKCGCGQRTPIATMTRTKWGYKKGEHTQYIRGHATRGKSSIDNYIVDEVTGCWEWQGAKNDKGYGQLGIAGKTKYAHRVMYERFVGPIPAGLELDHLCRNRGCVNPAHLEPVTRSVNVLRGDAARTQNRCAQCNRLIQREARLCSRCNGGMIGSSES